MPRIYPILGLISGYIIVLLFNPARFALRDGFRCIVRFKRIWLTFALLGFAYFVFQFSTFTPIQNQADLDLGQITTVTEWNWPRLVEVWRETPLPALEGVAGLFDNATTTYPLSVLAALLLMANWRGLHGAFVRALRQRYRFWSWFIYLVVLLSALATLCKPVIFWKLPAWISRGSPASLFQLSASVNAVAEIFEYLFGVYIQVYLIAVCLAWIKGLSFEEEPLFRFAMRRFSYVLQWAWLLVIVSTVLLRIPLLLAYFTNVPDVLDYRPLERVFMSGLIIFFGSVQISLALHNENLRAAIRAHGEFIRRNFGRYVWFLLIAALHFFALTACDAVVRSAIADRVIALILWKTIYVCGRGLVTGWLLASWVCLFRQSEMGRAAQESWIAY